jgi:hypothetical protein
MAAIPLWMTDPVICAGFSFGEPLVSVEALSNLRGLLDSVRSRHSTRAGTEGSGQKSHKGATGLTSAKDDEGSFGADHTADVRSPGEREGKC